MVDIGAYMHKIQRIIYGMRKHNKGFSPENDRRNKDKSSHKGKSFSKEMEKNQYQNFILKAPISSQKMERRSELDEIIIVPTELEVALEKEFLFFTIESTANEEITVELEFFPTNLKSYLILSTGNEERFIIESQNNFLPKNAQKDTKSYLVDLKPKSKKTIYIKIKRKNNISKYNLYGIIDRFFINAPKLIVKVLKRKEKRFVESKVVPFIIPEKRKRPRNAHPIQSTKNVINNNRTSSVVKNETPSNVSVDNPLKPIDSKKDFGLEKDNYEFKKDRIESTKSKDRIDANIIALPSIVKSSVQGLDNHPPPKAHSNREDKNHTLSMHAPENKTNEIRTKASSPKDNKKLNNQYDKETLHCFKLLKIVLDDFEKICDLINQYIFLITKENLSAFIPTYLKVIQEDILPQIVQYLESLKKDESMGALVSCLLQHRKEDFNKAPFSEAISKILKGEPEELKAFGKYFQERIKRDLTLMIFDPFFCKMAMVRKENKVISAESMVRLEEIYKDTLNFLENHFKLKAISITLGQSRYNAEEHEIAGYEETSAHYRPRTIIDVQKWGYQSIMGKKTIEKAKVFLSGRVR